MVAKCRAVLEAAFEDKESPDGLKLCTGNRPSGFQQSKVFTNCLGKTSQLLFEV